MGVRRNVLLKAVVDEVEERVYHSSIGEDAADKGEAEDEIPELQVWTQGQERESSYLWSGRHHISGALLQLAP